MFTTSWTHHFPKYINFNSISIKFNALLIELLLFISSVFWWCCSSSHQLIKFNKLNGTSLWVNLLPIISFGSGLQSALPFIVYCKLVWWIKRLMWSRFIDSELIASIMKCCGILNGTLKKGERKSVRLLVGGQFHNRSSVDDVFCVSFCQ